MILLMWVSPLSMNITTFPFLNKLLKTHKKASVAKILILLFDQPPRNELLQTLLDQTTYKKHIIDHQSCPQSPSIFEQSILA